MASILSNIFNKFVSWLRDTLGISGLQKDVLHIQENVEDLPKILQTLQRNINNFQIESQKAKNNLVTILKSVFDEQSSVVVSELQNQGLDNSGFRIEMLKQMGELEKRIAFLQKEFKRFQANSDNIEEYSKLILLNNVLDQAERTIASKKK